MESVKVSVIMGIYNLPRGQKEVLDIAVNSILNQTFENFEFIICDDGSTDETYKILENYARKDNRILLIKNDKNRGLTYSLNHCLEYARGEYIARMDSDDYSHLDRFEKQVEFLEKNEEYGLCGSNMNLFNDDGIWGIRKYKEVPNKKDFLYRVATPHPTIMARRSAYKLVNNYRDVKSTVRVEDYDLFMRMFAAGVKMYNFQNPIFDYREDAEGAKKKKAKYRINEMKVRFYGFRKLKLMPIGLIYCLKPIVAIFVPQKFIKRFQIKK